LRKSLVPHNQSLQGRLLAWVLTWVLGLVVLVWLLTASLTWFDARGALDESLDSRLANAAALLVVQQNRELGDDGREVDAPTLQRHAPKVAFQVFHEGRLALRSANAPAAAMFGLADGEASGLRTVAFGGTTWRVFTTTGVEQDVQVTVPRAWSISC